jgi:hypothetical protein
VFRAGKGYVVLTLDEVTLRMLEVSDAAEWLAGEDDEQLKWLQMPAAPWERTERGTMVRCVRASSKPLLWPVSYEGGTTRAGA